MICEKVLKENNFPLIYCPHMNLAEAVKAQCEIKKEGKPRLEFSSFGEERLEYLAKSIEDAADKPIVIGIVRCWNKGPEEMRGFREELTKISQSVPALLGILLCLKGEDESGLTEKTLKEMAGKFPLPIIPVTVHHYSWTSGLNAGIAIINELCIIKEMNRDNVRVFNMSFDASIDEKNLNVLISRFDKRFVMSVRGNETGDFEALYSKLFTDPTTANPTAYVNHFRNTLALYGLRDLLLLGGFHPGCNVHGGMEDTEFYLRVLARARRLGRTDIILEFEGALREPVFYSDKRYRDTTTEKYAQKTALEVASLARIFADELSSSGGTSVPENERDFALRT
jgi:hypothetical protein